MKGLLIFAAGLAVGAVAGALVVKNKVLADAKAEIEEVRDYYRSQRGEVKQEEVEEVKEMVEETIDRVQDMIKEHDNKKEHVNYNKLVQNYNPSKNVVEYDDPFIIDPSEFGENDDYDTMTLTYFADGVLVDDVDDIVDEPDIVVGLENLKVFEEFGASSVYVRNDIYKTDYEIIRDDWNYSDLKDPYPIPTREKKPHQL